MGRITSGAKAVGSGIAALALSAAAPAVPAGVPAITELHVVTLHPGINRVPGFLVGGGTATIVEGWRGNGNAHGYHVWMVLGGASEGQAIGVVGIEGTGHRPVEETIIDEPFDGERVLGAVRFATARFEPRPVALLIRADLDRAPSGMLADHATAMVRWYRLDHDDDAVAHHRRVCRDRGDSQRSPLLQRRACDA